MEVWNHTAEDMTDAHHYWVVFLSWLNGDYLSLLQLETVMRLVLANDR